MRETGKFLRNTYTGARKVGGLINGYANLFSRGLGILQSEFGDNKAFSQSRRALEGFSGIRKAVVDLDNQGQRVASRFQEAGII